MPPTSAAAATLAIRVLGPLEVAVAGVPLVVDTRKALAILALLAVERRPFARDELAAMLWPESDDESARGALRRTLSVLRAALGDRGLLVDRSSVALDEAATWVDLWAVEGAVAAGSAPALAAAAEHARGPLLAGFSLRDSAEFDEWRATRAGSVERTVGTLLDRLAETAEAAGDQAAATAAAARRVELDPLDEAAQRRLMALLARSGDRAGAIRQYRACLAVLERELGVAPLAETTALYDDIRDGRFPVVAPTIQTAGSEAADRVPSADAMPIRLPLVGRASELEAIEAVRDGAMVHGAVVVVTGEAGIGKSRLVEAAAERAVAAGSTVLTARAYPTETGIAYGTIVDLLRAGIARPDSTRRLGVVPKAALAEVARLVDLPDGLTPQLVPGGGPAAGPAGQARLLDAIASTLVALVAPPAGGLLVVEDLHWADHASREALGWLARRLTGRTLVLLLTWRPEDLDELGAAFASSVEALPPTAELHLPRLDRDAVAALVAAAAALGIDAPSSDGLLEASEGLPLFLVEALAGGLAVDARVGGAAGAWPEAATRGVRALLRERLATVSETGAQVLSAAAVLGRSFDLGSVRAVGGRSEDETLTAVEELVRRGLVREVPGSAGGEGWDFAHARLRDAAYEATGLARRRILHRRAADHLRLEAPTRDPGRLVQLAGHELAAGRDGEAADAYRQAGLRAAALHANREAAAHLEAAIALRHPDAAELQVALGDARTAIGDYRGAIAALEAAAAGLDEGALPDVELRLGRAHARRGDLATATSHLDAAIDSLRARPTPDPSRIARALVERALVAHRTGDGGAAVADAEEALELAARAGDSDVLAAAHRVLGLVARDRGDLDAAGAALERSLELAVDDPDGGAAIAALNALALVRSAEGDRDAAIALLERALAAAGRTGERHLAAAIENNLADQLHAAGRPDEAMARLKAAVAAFADVGGQPGDAGPLEPEIWKLVTF